MSISDLAKVALVNYYNSEGIPTKASEWKRRTKIRHGDYIARMFEHTSYAMTAEVISVDEEDIEDADELCVWEGGLIGFRLVDDMLSFTPMSRWRRTRSFPNLNDHIERGIVAIPLKYCGDDAGDNLFAIREPDAVRADLIQQGYIDVTKDDQ